MAETVLFPVTGSIATWVGTYLLHSTVLLVVAWGITRLRDLPPTVADVLWKTALVAGMVSASAGVVGEGLGAAAVGLGEGAPMREVHVEHDVVESVNGRSPQGLGLVASDVGPSGSDAGMVQMTTMVARVRPGVGGWPLFFMISGWLAVGVAGLARLFLLGREVRLLRAHFTETAPRVQELLRSVSGGLPDVSVVRCDAVEAPCVLPGRTIALPGRCEDEMTDSELRAVLGHEVGHVARNDVWWTGMLRGLASVLWLQPLNWFALARVREAAELICDDWALSRTEDSYGLAASISRVAGWAEGPPPAFGVSMAGDSRRLPDRVRRILDGEGRDRVHRWVAPLVACALLLPTYWLPVVHAGPVRQEVMVETRTLMAGDPTTLREFESTTLREFESTSLRGFESATLQDVGGLMLRDHDSTAFRGDESFTLRGERRLRIIRLQDG